MRFYISLLCILFASFCSVNAQKITFTPQWTAQSQFAGYYAALENGYYAEAGLDVAIVHPTKSYSSMSMLNDGTANIITCELIQAIMAAEDGVKLVNLMQTVQHSTLALISRLKDVSQMSQLAGCRVATWKVGFNEFPHMIDKEENLGINWVKVINPVNVYISGAVDATLVKSYNEQILFSMSGITPASIIKFSELGFDYPEDGLYVALEFFDKYPQLCRRFAEASRKGWEWVRNNRNEALEIVMKYVKEENIPTNIYNQKWMLEAILEAQSDEKGGEPSYRLGVDEFDSLNELLLKYGYISKPVVYESFIGNSL